MRFLIACLCALSLGGAAHATTIGSYTFDPTAFVDGVGASSGPPTGRLVQAPPGPTITIPVATAVIGSDLDSFVTCGSGLTCAVELLFTDAHILNGIGADLVVFEGGTAEAFSLTINGTTQTVTGSLLAGVTAINGSNVNAAEVDLDDYGVAPGAAVSSVVLNLFDTGATGSADVSVVGALNVAAVPLPIPALLLLSALGALGLARRRAT